MDRASEERLRALERRRRLRDEEDADRAAREEAIGRLVGELLVAHGHDPEALAARFAAFDAGGWLPEDDEAVAYAALVDLAGRELAEEVFGGHGRASAEEAASVAAELRRDYEAMAVERERRENAVAEVEAVTVEARRLEAELGLTAGTADVRVDDEAARRTAAAGARGLAEGRTVWLDPAHAAGPEGAALLAHELTHVAQRGLAPAPVEVAEAEAEGMGRRSAAGGRLSRPMWGLEPTAVAADVGGARARARKKAEAEAQLRMELVVWKAARRLELGPEDLKVCADPETEQVTRFVPDPGARGGDLLAYLTGLAQRAEDAPAQLEEARILYAGRIVEQTRTHLDWLVAWRPLLAPHEAALVTEAKEAVDRHVEAHGVTKAQKEDRRRAPLMKLAAWDELEGSAQDELVALYWGDRITKGQWEAWEKRVADDAGWAGVKGLFEAAFHFESHPSKTSDPVIATRGHQTYRLRGNGKELVAKRDLDEARRGVERLADMSVELTIAIAGLGLGGLAANATRFARVSQIASFASDLIGIARAGVDDPELERLLGYAATASSVIGVGLSWSEGLDIMKSEIDRIDVSGLADFGYRELPDLLPTVKSCAEKASTALDHLDASLAVLSTAWSAAPENSVQLAFATVDAVRGPKSELSEEAKAAREADLKRAELLIRSGKMMFGALGGLKKVTHDE